jgi:hypothetical protein
MQQPLNFMPRKRKPPAHADPQLPDHMTYWNRPFWQKPRTMAETLMAAYNLQERMGIPTYLVLLRRRK